MSRNMNDSKFLTLLNASEFRPIQQRSEVLALLTLIRSKRYSSMLEIGTSTGGTSVLISRALEKPAQLTTVDLEKRYDAERLQKAFPRRSDVRLLIADSHDKQTVDLVKSDRSHGFDVVFIDGDHSYEGVRLDTLRFAPLTNPGGVLVFHDIVDADVSGHSSHSDVYVGGVPSWWRQMCECVGERTEEFVADRNQSGYGIGVVHLPEGTSAVGELVAEWSELEMLT